MDSLAASGSTGLPALIVSDLAKATPPLNQRRHKSNNTSCTVAFNITCAGTAIPAGYVLIAIGGDREVRRANGTNSPRFEIGMKP